MDPQRSFEQFVHGPFGPPVPAGPGLRGTLRDHSGYTADHIDGDHPVFCGNLIVRLQLKIVVAVNYCRHCCTTFIFRNMKKLQMQKL